MKHEALNGDGGGEGRLLATVLWPPPILTPASRRFYDLLEASMWVPMPRKIILSGDGGPGRLDWGDRQNGSEP